MSTAAGILLTRQGACINPGIVFIGVPLPYGFGCLVLVFATTILGMLPPVIYLEIKYRRERRIVEQVPVFLKETSILIRGGTTFMHALLKASEAVDRILGSRIRIFVYMVERGTPIYQAYQALTQGFPPEPANLLYSLVEAYESGGKAGDVLGLSAEYGFRLRDFDRQREAELKPYLYISLMALVIFNVAGLFLISLAHDVSRLPVLGMHLGSPELFASVLFYSMIIVSVFSGLLSGKIVRGRMRYGLTYSLIFIATTAFFLYLARSWFSVF